MLGNILQVTDAAKAQVGLGFDVSAVDEVAVVVVVVADEVGLLEQVVLDAVVAELFAEVVEEVLAVVGVLR